MPQGVQVPSARGLASSGGDYAYGIAGGVVYNLVSRFSGSSLIGSAVAAVLAGSVVKGTRGEVIAVMAGFAAANSSEVQGLVNRIPVIGRGGN